MLARHDVAGRLSLTELESRLDAVRMGRTRGQLAAMTADLPRPSKKAAVGSWLDRADRLLLRAHASTFVAINVLLIVIWALVGQHCDFWPPGRWCPRRCCSPGTRRARGRCAGWRKARRAAADAGIRRRPVSGWARQPGKRTIQEELEGALGTIARVPVSLTVAGRTDAGVHALAQVASYDGPAVEPRRVNALLPPEIAVLACDDAPPGSTRAATRPRAPTATGCWRGGSGRRSSAAARAAVAARVRLPAAGGVRGAAAGHARLHCVHADGDRAPALRLGSPGTEGARGRRVDVLDRRPMRSCGA